MTPDPPDPLTRPRQNDRFALVRVNALVAPRLALLVEQALAGQDPSAGA